ncbi:efflux RND transporter periplasmic adaptor subunit [Tenacibaculum sp. M341]|uniref:efflux RND transporter periplasmic adaptor subunit n=1 Tax=Tenacibaculum sp. M341 TaxID=2530339 RepID=UPI0010456A75|nr:efflux RND transporter periplasmic adaptor subunit [Tenacibaculum sp. M341]TCI84593.1 efflux RND transporter periplasmic adaptor subunit [Tenacibaculum sp. M341]
MDIQLEEKKGIKKKHIVIAIVVIAAFFIGQKLLFGFSGTTYKTDRNRLSIAEVKKGKFDDYISINGSVAPIATIYMDAYEGGRVVEKKIEEGAMVKKGEIILRLENQNLYERILSSENNLALKQNDLRSTRLNFDARQIEGQKSLALSNYELVQKKRAFEQNEALYKEELIAKEEYLKAKEGFDLAKRNNEIAIQQTEQDKKLRNATMTELNSDLARMRKTLSMVYNRIDHLNVRAPADGQLGFLDAEIGQSIKEGERIGQVNVLTDFKVEADIDEHYIDRVKRNLNAVIERNGKSYVLRLRKIFPEVRNGKFKVDLVFTDEKPETVRTGQNYSLKLQLGASNEALLIPRGGFYQSSGGQYVFVLSEDGTTALKRPVRLGKQNSKYFEVVEGLGPNEKVITSSYNGFGDAAKIAITN